MIYKETNYNYALSWMFEKLSELSKDKKLERKYKKLSDKHYLNYRNGK